METRAQYLARKRREHENYRQQVEADEAAKRFAGQTGALAGLGMGVPQGAFHMAQDVIAAASFAGRLLDPNDAEYSPKGQAAWDDVFRAGKRVTDYLIDRGSNPSKITADVNHIGVGSNVVLPLKAAPLARTVADEFRKQLRTGLSAGEGVFNVGALIGGAAELRSIPELRALSKGAAATDYLPAGAPQRVVDYMDTPYSGMGSHAPVPRSAKLPGGRPIPKRMLDSVFNKMMPPEGTPRGAFYRYHYAIDPSYYGGPVKRAFGGGGWSGKTLGWTKYGPLARAWYGTPWQTKLAGTALAAGLGWPVDQLSPPDDSQ